MARASLLAVGAALAVVQLLVRRGVCFVASPPATFGLGLGSSRGSGATPISSETRKTSPGLGGFAVVGALAIFGARLASRKSIVAPSSVRFTGVNYADVEEERGSQVAMGIGRRRRMGVGGWTCMVSGMRRVKGADRTYTGYKAKRYWYPNLVWKKLWWEEQKKWVVLRVAARTLKWIDIDGIQNIATRAGLDLFAWCLPHWDPASRQPLPLKVSKENWSNTWKKLWPIYKEKLNKDGPLAACMPDPRDITVGVKPGVTNIIRMQRSGMKARMQPPPLSKNVMMNINLGEGWQKRINNKLQTPPEDLPRRKKNMEFGRAKKALWSI